MTSWIFILGTNPALSVEEILTVLALSTEDVLDIGRDYLVLQTADQIQPVSLLSRLGGTIKIGRLVQRLTGIGQLTPELWRQALHVPEESNKMIFGFSQYGLDKSAYALQGIGLKVKKLLKAEGHNARLMANKEGQLSSVAVQKNNLVGSELLIVRGSKADIYLAMTEAVQDFEHYGERDYGRPERDSARGMIPPKLAQMMINLALIPDNGSLLDPFCGLGTIAQEAWLMNHRWQIAGSDSDQQAIEQAQKNLQWLLRDTVEQKINFTVAPVQNLTTVLAQSLFDAVVTEPYLGPARELQRTLTPERLDQIISEISQLYLQAFQQIVLLLKPGGRVVMVWPMYQQRGSYEAIPLIAEVAKLGFRLILPAIRHTSLATSLTERGTLWYHRPDQAVAREIVVWEKL